MSPQLTLQTPLQLPPSEIPTYLEQLWSHDEQGDKGANTFCLIVWQLSKENIKKTLTIVSLIFFIIL